MSRTLLEPTLTITSVLPESWEGLTEAATERAQISLQAGLCEILLGMHCGCVGTKLSIDSVATTIQERIRALAITRRLDSDLVELATARGVDISTASQAQIAVVTTADEINSLIAMESVMTQETVYATVTDDEMATIANEVIGRHQGIRDPEWGKDLSQFVRRASPHRITGIDPASGLASTEVVAINLTTLRAEVDNNGEICCWMYEEPTIEAIVPL